MSTNPKFVKFLETLRDATRQGRLDWSKTAEEDTFRVLLNQTIVRVGKSFDEIGDRTYYFATLVDSEGETLEHITSDYDDDGAHFELLKDLYDMARRRSGKVDDLLDRLISDLNKSKV
jgi:hypothetical protein